MFIRANQIIEYIDKNEITKIIRILNVETEGGIVIYFDLTAPNPTPEFMKVSDLTDDIKNNIASIAEKDEFAPPVFSEDDLNGDKYKSLKKHRDYVRTIIEPLVSGENELRILFKKSRSRLVREAAKKHKVSRQVIYKWLRKYWRGGMTFNTLIPDYYKCGGKGKKRIYTDKKPGSPSDTTRTEGILTGVIMNDHWLKSIITGGHLFYENSEKPSLVQAYKSTIKHFHSTRNRETGRLILPDPELGEVYTERQFIYHYNKERFANLERVITRRYSKRHYDMNYAPRTGTFRETIYGPGSLYQIDATVADISLVSTLNPNKIIGRPTIFAVIDSFSKMIVGIAVRREKEDFMGYREALINVVQNKVAFAAEYEVTLTPEDWEEYPLPDQLIADRGAMESKLADSLVIGLGVQLSNAAPFRADWKAYVEQTFNQFNKKVIHRLPGAVPQDPEFGKEEYRHKSVLTFHEFMGIVIRMVVHYNNNHRIENFEMESDMIASELEPYPSEIYVWGCENRSVPNRRHTLEEVQIHLLPSKSATVKEHGIKFRNLYYTCQIEIEEGWRERAKNQGEWEIRMAYHPRKSEPVYLRFGDGRMPVECYLINRESPFINCEWDEIEDYFSNKSRLNRKAKSKSRQDESDLWEEIDLLVKKANKRKKSAVHNIPKQSQAAMLREIGSNMKTEIEIMNQVEASEYSDSSFSPLKSEVNESSIKKQTSPKRKLSLAEIRLKKNQMDDNEK